MAILLDNTTDDYEAHDLDITPDKNKIKEVKRRK